MKKIRTAWLLLLSTIWEVNAVLKTEVTGIDEMRRMLYEHTHSLEDTMYQWVNLEGLEAKIYLIRSFKTFGDKLEQNFPNPNYEYLDSLSSTISLWTRTQEELKAIDSLYNVFRRMQHEIIDLNMDLDLQKLSNMCDTILHDPNVSIVDKLAHIAESIVHDKLFILAYQVQ